MIITKEKRDQLQRTLKKRIKRLDGERQHQEQRPVALNDTDTSMCGCDFGIPCCPGEK